MKIFPELCSCCGGAPTKTSAAATRTGTYSVNSRPENVAGTPYHGEKRRTDTVTVSTQGRRKMKSANSSRQWKPSLLVISEDNMMVSDNSNNESSAKDKVKEKPKPKPISPYYGDEHWKSSGFWAMPGFAPSALPF